MNKLLKSMDEVAIHYCKNKGKGAVGMAKGKTSSSSGSTRKIRPALTPESRENQLIALATDLAEKQLLEGTASSQVISHFLKLGSTVQRLEREKLEEENKLLRAKTERLQSEKRSEELFAEAIKAFRNYNGQGDLDEEY